MSIFFKENDREITLEIWQLVGGGSNRQNPVYPNNQTVQNIMYRLFQGTQISGPVCANSGITESGITLYFKSFTFLLKFNISANKKISRIRAAAGFTTTLPECHGNR